MRFTLSALLLAPLLVTLSLAPESSSALTTAQRNTLFKEVERALALEERCDDGDKKSSKAKKTKKGSKSSSSGKMRKKGRRKHKSTAQTTLTTSKSSDSALISVKDAACGATGASPLTTVGAGPNGAQSFLDCGLSPSSPNSGWTPPHITLADIKIKSLDEVASTSTFSACKPYLSLFDAAATKYKVPSIILAAIAMQESSCDPNNSGDDGGAYGLMQITGDKCGGAPDGNCADPAFNIDVGAKTFVQALSDAKGNILEAFGGYNGWYAGMTYNDVLRMKDGGCCDCMQNVDYLQQMLNGWLQGVDAYAHNLGTVQNLKICGN